MAGNDEKFLRRAIEMAKIAREKGQEPFGAVLVKNDKIVAEGTNKIYELSDPTAHAESTLIKEYCQKNHLMNLTGYTIYCSTEPCLQCAGSIFWSKISRVVFSVPQEKLHKISGGSTKSDCKTLLKPHQNIEVIGPALVEEGLGVFKDYQFGKMK